MGTYSELTAILAHWRRPVRSEFVATLAEPQRRIIRSLNERAAQLQVFEDEYTDLVEFARVRAIPNYGRF